MWRMMEMKPRCSREGSERKGNKDGVGRRKAGRKATVLLGRERWDKKHMVKGNG